MSHEDLLKTALHTVRINETSALDQTRNEQTNPLPEDAELWRLYRATWAPSCSRTVREQAKGRSR